MKVLTTTGLTKLIELSKNTFLDKDNVIDVSDALATVAVTGSYNDLTNKPTIPAAQVNSDWNATEGVAQILNKPTLADVATTGSYSDLSDKPTIEDLTTATQQAALNSGANTTNINQITTNKNNITTINSKIPAAATSSNQLADKAFVNSSINAVAAYYVTSDAAGDAFATKAALDTGPYYHDGSTRTPTENDYAIVAADETKNNACTRYTYTGSQWSFQYIVNNTSFTQAQINAINSGITSGLVNSYNNHIADTSIHITSYNDLTDKPSFNGITLDNNTSKSFFGTSDTAAATVQKEVSIPSITELKAGQIIIVIPTITSTVANSTLKLNTFTAYPMRYGAAAITTSTDSIVWNANYPSIFLFDGNYWIFLGHGLDNNSTYTLNYSVDAGQYTAGTGTYAITRYSIVAQKPDMTWEKITATNANYSTGTTKAVNTSGFLLNQLRYYYTTTNYAAGAKIATNYFYEKAASVDMRYSTNCGSSTDWALGDYIYLVGTLGVDGLFYLDTTKWWTNNLPTTNDGKLYIRLGLALAAAGYTMSFFENRPIFYHNGTKICEYKVADNKQDTLVSGTNIKTINSTSLLGSGNISITGLPSQSGQSGKYLTTNGTSASWDNAPGVTVSYDSSTETLTII